MNYKKIFFDANIIIDLFDKRRAYHQLAKNIVDYCIDNNMELYTSCDIITNAYYFLKKIDKNKALESMKAISIIFELFPFSNRILNKAIYLMLTDKNFKDLEDTIQYVLAKENGCDLILTNDKDFYSPDIEILSSKEFVGKYIK